jgi:hypothetical protein
MAHSHLPNDDRGGILPDDPPAEAALPIRNSDEGQLDAPKRILVLGSGNFGSCLADHLATSDLNVDVSLWSRDAKTVELLNNEHKNPKYLTEHVSRICVFVPENIYGIES